METQSFANHVRVHPLYHYFLVPVSLLLIPSTLVNLALNLSIGSGILLTMSVLMHMVIFLARDYAKKNQDRIIRAELRLRYFQLTRKRLEDIEGQYSLGQLLALRFTSDDEFIELLDDPKTQAKKPDEIKRTIVQWNADLMRV